MKTPTSTRPRRCLPHALALYLLVAAGAGFGCRDEAPEPSPEPPPQEAETPPSRDREPDAPEPTAEEQEPEGAEDEDAAAPAEPPVHLVRHRGDPSGPIGYLVVEPAEGPPDLPLVIALHGRGDRPDRFADLVERLRLPVRGIVARAPLEWGPRAGRQWFDMRADDFGAQILQRVEDLETLADKLERKYPGAPKPILLGFSQGAMLAVQAVARAPERFGGAVALSGFLPVTEGNEAASEPVPLLVTAGERDRVVPPERTLEAVEALKKLGHDPEVMRFRGGHSIPKDVLARTREFLRQQGD
ncbi:MAG: alpha/beta hydrolase [Myxococcota bacterium]